MIVNQSLQNFASGELSPKLRGRKDLKIYFNGLERAENIIVETQGNARNRTGSVFVNHTRLNQEAYFIPFQFSTQQSYLLEFTPGYMRVYKDTGIVLTSSKSITGATQANPVVITATGHGYSDGDEVYISDVGGMVELNNKFYLIANSTANTFELQDIDGTNIDGTGFTAYTSGGTVQKVFELQTPYLSISTIKDLKYDQDAEVMYFAVTGFEPRKLTVSADDNWTISIYTRTNDPFTDKKVITGITQANPAVVTSTAHGFSNGDIVAIEEVVGMTELNSRTFTVANVTANTFELQGEDSTGYSAYVSGGYATNAKKFPRAVTFYEGRLFFAGSELFPETFWGSRGPDSTTGAPRYDDFTGGTDPDHAIFYTIASTSSGGSIDFIYWIVGGNRSLIMGTYGGVTELSGSGNNEPLTADFPPISRPVDYHGVEPISPIPNGNIVLYVQRGGLITRSLEFDLFSTSLEAIDRNITSDLITEGGIKRIAFSNGRPDLLWAVRADGVLLALTFKSKEDVSGWQRQVFLNGEVIDVGILPQSNGEDKIYLIVKREINGKTRHYVEYLSPAVVYPEFIDFYTNKFSEDSDKDKYLRALYEKQKEYIYLDSSLSYTGTDIGSIANATITPGATTGNGVTFTSNNDVFTSSDVGREIWKKAIDGVGEGRAVISSFTDAKNVVCNIELDFNNIASMTPGNWFLTTDSLSNLDHLEGEDVGVVTDGAIHPDKRVTSGALSLDGQASVVHVGKKITSIMITMPLEMGGFTGPGRAKVKNAYQLAVIFLNSLGVKYGTDIYNLTDILFTRTDDIMDRPSPLFSGTKMIKNSDTWKRDLQVMIVQETALPFAVQYLDIYAEVTNEEG
jgi:hypothetical protein